MDSLGRYYLFELETRARNLLDAINEGIDANGNQIASQIVYQNISNTDLDNQINESLVALYTEAIMGHEDLFAVDVYLDIREGQLQYSFPPNMLQLRWMRWKPDSLQPPSVNQVGSNVQLGAHPFDYVPMNEVSNPQDIDMSIGYYRAPTWRRNGDGFTLGDYPKEDNKQGILLNIVALPPQLVNPGPTAYPPSSPFTGWPVIQGLFARLSQEVVIYDTAYKLGSMKLKQVSPEISKGRDEWHQRFMTAIENAQHQMATNMTTTRLISSTFSGHPISQSGSRFGGTR